MTGPSMNPTSRTRLANACRRYLAAAPWTCVADDYLFGIHDRTGGQFGCVSVLGAAGQEHGLSVLLGPTGFALHRKLVDGEIDPSTLRARSSGMSLMLMEVAPASRAYERVRPLLVDRSTKVRAGTQRGYLAACRVVAGQLPRALDSEEALFLARCLETVAELAESGRLGDEPAEDGGRVLFYNVTDDGEGPATVRRSYRRLTEVDVQHRPVVLDPTQLARLRARPRHEGRYLLSIFSPAGVVDGGIVWTLLLADAESRPLRAEVHTTFEAAAQALFDAFEGGGRRASGRPEVRVPREVWTDSYPVYEATKDTLASLEVRVVCDESLVDLEALRENLNEFLAGA